MARFQGWVILWAVLWAAAAGAAEPEYRVKAAFLYHFAQLTTWERAAPAEGFEVCVVGDDPFGPELDLLEGKRVHGLRVGVRRCGRTPCRCPVVFVARSEAARLPEVLGALDDGVLTVSDIPGFADRGGMIELVERDGRLRFRIHRGRAGQAGLRFDARLLRLAEEVLP
ncbi:YfiR family protein [Deferrisoma sp.]